MATDILIVDDENDIREAVAGILSDEGHGTRIASNSDEALAAIEARRPHLVFLDIWLQGSRLDGLQILGVIKEQHPTLPVVMISGHGNIETAVQAIKIGAYDFIEKPFKADRLVLVADRALETSRLKREVKELKAARHGAAVNRIVGRSPSAANQLAADDRESRADQHSRIMIIGPSRCRQGAWPRAPSTTSFGARERGRSSSINAAAISRQIRMEIELFGVDPTATARPNARSVRSKRPMAARCIIDESRGYAARTPRTRSCACWSTRSFLRVGGDHASVACGCAHRVFHQPQSSQAEIAAGNVP